MMYCSVLLRGERMNEYRILTDNGFRTYWGDDIAHAIEQHADAFGIKGDEEPLAVYWVGLG